MQDIHEIQKHFQKFKADLADLALQLGEAQSDITTKGLIPNRSLIEQIEKFLVNFQVFRSELRAEANDLGIKLSGSLTNPSSVGDLEDILQLSLGEISQRQSGFTEAAFKVEQVLGLNHVDDTDFEPLKAVKLEAEGLVSKFKASSSLEKSALVLEEASPVLAFYELATSWDKIDDQHCEELRSKVASRFSNALAMAAIRGKILQGATPVRVEEPADEFVEIPNAPEPEEPEVPAVPAPAPEPVEPEAPVSNTPFPWKIQK